MNTRDAYTLRAQRALARSLARRNTEPGRERRVPVAHSPSRAEPHSAASAAPNAQTMAGIGPSGTSRHAPTHHPLTDLHANARLAHCEEMVKGRFDAILPTLQKIAVLPQGLSFAEAAQSLAQEHLGHALPQSRLENAWLAGLDLKPLYAHCVFTALEASVTQFATDLFQQRESVQDTRNFFLDCGFHAINISPCSDGRLKGLSRYILRLPLTSFSWRKAYAGALFDIEDDIQQWTTTELRRFREGVPTLAATGSRYLKVAVYHRSSSDPGHQGCAAHASDDREAIRAALERLQQFREAIENAFCCGASTDLLLIGVDTDNDSIRVHVPDADGDISPYRFVDNAELHAATAGLSADQACLAIYDAIRHAGHASPWGQGRGEPHEGMRRLVANLLINNLSQIDYVQEMHEGRYPDIGHAERYISVGDGFEEVQMRNIAYYAHLHTLEEGVADMDVGIKIFKGLNIRRGLPIPIAIHYRYDARVPGARERAIANALRVRDAIRSRYADLHAQGWLFCHLSVQDRPTGSPLEILEGVAA